MSIQKIDTRKRRHHRIRGWLSGSPERPRLCVFISNQHLYAQIIDDLSGKTLVSMNTLSKDLRGSKPNMKSAVEVGKRIAELAKQNNINQVVFDRAGYRYHGRVKALADAARQAGLKF